MDFILIGRETYVIIIFYLITASKKKISFALVTPRVGLRPVALDLNGLSQNPRCSRKRRLL